MKTENLELWNHMPWAYLPESFKVDFSLLLLNLKPSVRFVARVDFYLEMLQQIMSSYCIALVNNSVYISRTKNVLDRIIISDHKLTPHEKELGYLLGYPSCCCEKVESIGEYNIDLYETQFVKTVERKSLLDISHYKEGIALLSHIPCSLKCNASLKMAESFLNLIKISTNSEKPFSLWRNRLLTYYQAFNI